jgi:hypothetical protein
MYSSIWNLTHPHPHIIHFSILSPPTPNPNIYDNMRVGVGVRGDNREKCGEII